LLGEIRSLTAYSRFVAILISLLPVITALIIFLMNPSYYDTVRTSIITQAMLIMALLGIIVGNFIMQRIMKIRV
jgi:tight adherence protein B